MKNFFLSVLVGLAALLVFSPAVWAAEASNNLFYRAEIVSIDRSEPTPDQQSEQTLSVKILSGTRQDETVQITHTVSPEYKNRLFDRGDKVVILETPGLDGPDFFITDHYRLPSLVWVIVFFLLIAVWFARKRGAFAIVGLVIGLLVLAGVVVPRITAGWNPLLIGIPGVLVISFVSLYIAHGWNKKTHLAMAATLLSITIATVLSVLAVYVTQLFGFGSEDAQALQLASGVSIDLKGLLFVSILIGVLGVLDDVTTALAATVEELHHANGSLDARELYRRSLNVGREHIASLINTLVFAYAGAAMPLFLLFSLDLQPFWVTLNSEFLAEEIVRTIVGSTALVLAVPITAALAARAYGKHVTAGKKSPGK